MEIKTITINGQRFVIRDSNAATADQLESLESIENRVTIIDNTADDEHYPTAKAVYDAVAPMGLLSAGVNYEKYFDIDENGIVSLKDVYRGDPTKQDCPYSQSNEGWGFEGSLIGDLPEKLVIPNTINGITVTGFQDGIFYNNNKVKEITIPDGVEELPKWFCRNAANMRVIHNTEQIKKIGASIIGNTRIEKISFPNLEDVANTAFGMSVYLHTVDIGNKITEIPTAMFAQCVSLSIVNGGGNVTVIDKQAFYQTYNLKTLPFLQQVTYIGKVAFFRSRIQFDWDSIKDQCTFDTYATPVQDNTTDYWTGADVTPCKNQLGVIMSQTDKRWSDRVVIKDKENSINFKSIIDGTLVDLTYGNSCTIFTAMHIHSALSHKHYNLPDEFVEEAVSKYPQWGSSDGTPNDLEDIFNLFEHLDYKATMYQKVTQDSYQAMLDALSRGAYIYTQVSTANKPDNGHVFMIYGINGNGEVLAVDPQNLGESCRVTGDIEKLQLCRMPYQNITGPNSQFIVVEKKEE